MKFQKDTLKGQRTTAVRLKNARKLTNNSQRWLMRQLNDPYVQQAQKEGLRSRAAYKLQQLDDKFHFLKKGTRVVDLGAAPGGWSQIAAARVDPNLQGNLIVAIDLLDMIPVPGVTFLQGDFFDESIQHDLKSLLTQPAQVVLSDMAASTTGHSQTDHLRTTALAEAAFEFARTVLSPGGTFVTKVFQGGADHDLLQSLKENFKDIKHIKPLASRKESPEMYVLAFGFKG
ncbi:MAG: RlmE family RNA methyltransferase [Janthinobacterium lividum]